jgi:hypothetical protein
MAWDTIDLHCNDGWKAAIDWLQFYRTSIMLLLCPLLNTYKHILATQHVCNFIFLRKVATEMSTIPSLVSFLFYVGFEILTAVIVKSSILWDRRPCSPLKIKRHFGGTYRLHLQVRTISQTRNQSWLLCLSPSFTLVPCLTYCSNVKMEATCSFEASVDFQRPKRHYIPEDRTLLFMLLSLPL